MKMIYLFILIFPLFSFSQSKSQLRFEPIYGIETSFVRYPEPSKYVTRGSLGVRALYGVPLLSGELELSQSKSQENYSDQKVEDTSDRASLGLRSHVSLSSFLSAFARAGGRASQGKTIITTNSDKNEVENPLRIDPYAGAGLQVRVASNFGLNAGVTIIRNQENKFDTQYTFGVNARLGK
jgi:hypothetical protein